MAITTLIPASAMNFTENQQACIVLEKLWSQREAARFCDVVLHVQGQKFQAHRNVLAACSPYFDSVLKTHKVIKEQLTITCQNLDAFQLLLNYMYTGAVVIDKNNVSELLRLANHFLVIKLKNYCAEYLDRYLDPSNCLTVKDMAEKYNLPVLQKNASAFIHNHIVEVFEQSEILEFNLNKLEAFLKEKQGLIPQHILLSFICKWVEHDISKRESDMRTLLTFMSWESIELQYLEDHLKSSSLLRNNPKCMYLVLVCLEENKINHPEFQGLYSSLKGQYGPGGTNVDSDSFMNIAISAAIQGLQKYPMASGVDENTPITVAPLEKEQVKERNTIVPLPEVPASKESSDNETSNSSFDDAAGDCGGADDFDDDSESSDEKPLAELPTATTNQKAAPKKGKQKAKTPSPLKKAILTTMTTRRAAQGQKVPPLKITRKSGKISAKPTTKNDKNSKQSKQSALVPYHTKPNCESTKKRYVSETDTEDDDDDDGDEGTSSATDSSVEESVNGYGNKSKWKDGVKCPSCSYIAHSSVRLEQHVSRIHAKDVTYKCKVCDFTCKWNREYYSHMKSHFIGPPFRCETCEYTCDRIQFLLSHRMRHTDERPFKCDECDHRCRTKANLDCHMRCHTGEKPYQCEHCERRFAIKASLDQHLASHREDRPFLCDTCGFSTKYQSHLFSHKRIHTGDVFRCHFPNCKYSTPKKSQLGSHHRTHTAVRSHICSICGRAFIEKSHLVRHERIHLNEKPFKCEHCDYCSSRRDKLKEHFRKHHGENATAKGPYRPRKQRRQGYDVNAYSPPNKSAAESENNQLQVQPHLELQTAVSAINANNPPPTPVVYSYESSHQETLHSHAAVALQQLGAAAHNYQVAFMEQRHHQPHHHHHHHQHPHQHHTHPHVGPTPPSAVPAMIPDQNRVNVVAHDGTNVVGQPSEFSPFMSFM
ncbi:GDNF-inducible zinc finger protein 1-like [Uloborus diversus]|uniref:GDNF-inducible zinc finger protein 1-like n=1 Tax=Uloborus diversus TaxID=327109 RepID=UPI00240906B6|nr:GDNF-inducible zinc finger protein 1-like [Uloborus diversus]